MDATSIEAGPYYVSAGGESIAFDPGSVTVAGKEGAGHLPRGRHGFVDLSVFQALGLTTGPLKRKVIWTHREDVEGDAIEANVKCVVEQVAYLMGLPSDRKPDIVVYHVDDVLSESGVSEAFVAVDEGFADEVFDDLYSGPGYPEYKRTEPEDYIPEFLRNAPSGNASGLEARPTSASDGEPADWGENPRLRDCEPRWKFVSPPMAPTWRPLTRFEKDFRREGERYLESDIHKVYRGAVNLADGLAKTCEQGSFPEFSFFLEALASRLRAREAGEDLALDLERRAPFFRYGRFQACDDGEMPPTLSEVLLCIDRLHEHRRYLGAYGDALPCARRNEVEGAVKEAIRDRSGHGLSTVARRLDWECQDCLVEGMGPESLCLARAVLFLSKAQWEIGDRSRLNDVASAHGILAWAYELEGEWREALEHHRLALAGYRACEADGGWFYSEDIADQAYCCAYLTRDRLEAEALLRECIDVYRRLPVDARSVSGLARSYELLGKVVSSDCADAEGRALRKKADDLKALYPELLAGGWKDIHLDECLVRYELVCQWAE